MASPERGADGADDAPSLAPQRSAPGRWSLRRSLRRSREVERSNTGGEGLSRQQSRDVSRSPDLFPRVSRGSASSAGLSPAVTMERQARSFVGQEAPGLGGLVDTGGTMEGIPERSEGLAGSTSPGQREGPPVPKPSQSENGAGGGSSEVDTGRVHVEHPRPATVHGDRAPASQAVAKSTSVPDLQAVMHARVHSRLMMNRKHKQLEVSPGQWEWLRVDIRGDKSFMFMGKVATSRRIGVPLRDLRMLEPQLVGQYPNTIMSRDKVILVNLAPILCVIGTKEMFMLNFKEPVSSRAVDALVEKLQGKVAHHSVEEQAPFELVCLECVLQALIKHLGDVVAEHEISAHTTMDALVNQVTRLGLESVRKIKTKLASSVENIESLRSLLEKLLESSASMLGLYLSSPELVDEEVKAAMDEELADDDADLAAPLAPMDRETRMAMMQQARKAIQDEVEQEYVEDVEMLLEAYLVQVGLLTKKVAAISQYMDDTQDFIHANQDNQRNQLLMLNTIVTSAAFCIGITSAISGLFGMNTWQAGVLASDLPAFLVILLMSAILSGGAFAIILYLLKRWKLLNATGLAE